MHRTAFVWIAGILGVAIIGALDYFSGIELRLFPLYYVPIAFVAWRQGSGAALVIATLATATWVVSNFLADLRFSSPTLWVMNGAMQGTSFSIIGLLIARLHESLTQERQLSRTDALTQLLNSRAFYEEGARLLSLCRRNRRPMTVAYIDLDNFKEVNDRQGHRAGDHLLHRVAMVLRTSLRPSDLSARLGGDEFAVLLPETSPHQAEHVLERMRKALADALLPADGIVTATIGAASFQDLPETMEAMVHRADATMYRAKAAGKNQLLLDAVSTT